MKLIARSLTFSIAAVAAMLLISSAAAAQGRGERGGTPDWPPAGPTPRTADGHPDLSGNWQPNAIRQNVDMVGSGVDVPMLPAAEAVYKKRKENLSKDDPEARCLPPGVPRTNTTPYPWTIVHWEGDTLVVETVGQNDITWLDQSGIPHSTGMKVTERFTRTDFGHLEVVHIIDDPKTFSKPWTFTTHPSLLRGELIEYICQENNKDVEHLVGK